jgi:hypothetical protein
MEYSVSTRNMRNAYTILNGKVDANNLLGTTRYRKERNAKTYLKGI